MRCKHCGHNNLWKRKNARDLTGLDQYQCPKCLKYESLEPREPRTAKILLLDIETLPREVYEWSPKHGEFTPPHMTIKDWSISCWASKWLFAPEIMGEVVTPKEAIERKEGTILGGIWKLMDEADVIVTQNGLKFDIRKLNTKFIIYNYPPPSHYVNVDTLVAAKKFGFSYNSLNELAKEFGIGEKTEMKFDDWRACANGDKEALAHKLEYCKRDVAPLLEDVYLKLLPWMQHPNVGVYGNTEEDVCPKCESTDLRWDSKYSTPEGLWKGWRCNSCGSIGRGKSKKKHLIKSVSIKS